MKYAIWGSRRRARRIATCMDHEIDFFIDTDLSRQGTFYGKPVISPEGIKNWKDLFVYVPSNIYAEVVPLLVDKGLEENVNFISCPIEKRMKISFRRVQQYLKQYELDFQKMQSDWAGTVVIFSCLFDQENPYATFIAEMIRQGMPISVVSENYFCDIDLLCSTYRMNFKCLAMSPLMDSNVCVVNGHLEKSQVDDIVKDTILYNAMLHHRSWCHCEIAEDLSEDSSCCMIYVMKKFAELFVKYLHPKKVICHGSSIPFHGVLEYVCARHDIPVGYTHEGIIPGTYVIETEGEMGHSLPAIYPRQFSALPVSRTELEHTRKVWDYLFESKLNRKIQPKNDCLNYIHICLRERTPTIFFAGQNDVGSHMIPYTEITKKYHSPMFKSSLAAAIYLANICQKNGWNFLYKPHPDYRNPKDIEQLPQSTIYIEQGDINDLIDVSDVTVTILSTTNYNALIRHKPVVMLGYNQTKGKGCTYEAFEKDRIETEIKEALEKGFTKDQQEAFLKHMAQCLKYYLYDDLQERPIRYGRSVPKSIDEFYELERLLR